MRYRKRILFYLSSIHGYLTSELGSNHHCSQFDYCPAVGANRVWRCYHAARETRVELHLLLQRPTKRTDLRPNRFWFIQTKFRSFSSRTFLFEQVQLQQESGKHLFIDTRKQQNWTSTKNLSCWKQPNPFHREILGPGRDVFTVGLKSLPND